MHLLLLLLTLGFHKGQLLLQPINVLILRVSVLLCYRLHYSLLLLLKLLLLCLQLLLLSFQFALILYKTHVVLLQLFQTVLLLGYACQLPLNLLFELDYLLVFGIQFHFNLLLQGGLLLLVGFYYLAQPKYLLFNLFGLFLGLQILSLGLLQLVASLR